MKRREKVRESKPKSQCLDDTPVCAQLQPPSPVELKNPNKLSAHEYDAIFAERTRRFDEAAARRKHRGIVDPLGHIPLERLRGKHAIGIEPNAQLRKCVVVSDGYRRHRTVATIIGTPCCILAGQVYADGNSGSQRATSEDRTD
jgi:hypothetical protein